jgi:hypothetical protein
MIIEGPDGITVMCTVLGRNDTDLFLALENCGKRLVLSLSFDSFSKTVGSRPRVKKAHSFYPSSSSDPPSNYHELFGSSKLKI